HAPAIGVALSDRRMDNGRQLHVPVLQVHSDAVVVVGPERAAGTALPPVRPEHEVIDEQLARAGEQVRKGLFALGSLENVVLVDPHPRQGAPLRAQPVALPCELLLLDQQRLARGKPILARYDVVPLHGLGPSRLTAWGAAGIP